VSEEKWYKLPQGASDAVAADGIPRQATAIDQDGNESQHVLYIDLAITPAVQSMLLSEWTGEEPIVWEGE